VVGSCEHGDKKSGFVNSRDFLELLSNCKVFKEVCSFEIL